MFDSPRYTSAVASRKSSSFGNRRLSEIPASSMPSSPPTRLSVTMGRSVQGMTWLCIWLTLPNEARILPTLTRKFPGREVKVTKPSSTPTSSLLKVRKKSARA